MYVIVTNDVNWHRENLRSDRENTENLKMQFEWVPCQGVCEGNVKGLTIQPGVRCVVKVMQRGRPSNEGGEGVVKVM